MGPAVDSEQKVKELIDAGMNMARMNLSHGTYAEHQVRFDQVRAGAKAAGRPIAILVDLQGPKIRLARFIAGPHELARGDIFTITTDEVDGTKDRVGTTYKGLPGDCKVGDHILIDDGKVTVQVTQVSGNDVITTVIEAGVVSNNKGINLPGVAVSVPAMSEKDIEDLRWGLRAGADFIALSFVRDAADIKDVHTIMDEEGIRIPVIAKIEKPQAVAHINEIIEAFDGIMVARGDLGVELPIEDVPLVQKLCVELARDMAKPVIVATQMLDSMITATRPTRAEVSDVANAVLDGTDALMLSGETSVGAHPRLVVETMSRIIEHVEREALASLPPLVDDRRGSTARALTHAAVGVADEIEATHLIAFTETGLSARLIARWRNQTPLLAFTPNSRVRSQLSLVWGVETFLVAGVTHTDDMVDQVDQALLDIGRASNGDRVVIVAGVPPGIPGTTNGMRVHKIGSGPRG